LGREFNNSPLVEKWLEDRPNLSDQEYQILYALCLKLDRLDAVIRKRDASYRQRQSQRALAPPRPPRRPVAAPRRARVRRAAPPIASRALGGARAGPAQAKDPDPPEEPGIILRRFAQTRAWALLGTAERRRVIAAVNGDLTAAALAQIDRIFRDAALGRDENPGCGPLWITLPFPVNGVLVRDRGGLWRVLQFDVGSTAPATWETRGSA
jgi:hypothetical protein